MHVPTTVRWGIVLALLTASISGVSVYLNGLVVKEFPDPILLAAVRNTGVGLVLAAILVGSAVASAAQRRHVERPPVTGTEGIGLLVLGVIGGGIPFALFFTGLSLVASPTAAVIHKTMFVWVALLAVPLLGERLGAIQLGALVTLLAGTLVLGSPTGLGAGPGEALILLATLLWAVEVIVARRLLGDRVGTLPAATARMAIGGLVLLAIVAAQGNLGRIAELSGRQWLIVAGTGLLLAGYVTTWYAALKRAPASTVTSALVLGAVITTALQSAAKGALPRTPELVALALVVLGVGLTVAAVGRVVRTDRRLAPDVVPG